SGRKPRSWETASLAWRIFPARSETNTGSGAFSMIISAPSERFEFEWPGGGCTGPAHAVGTGGESGLSALMELLPSRRRGFRDCEADAADSAASFRARLTWDRADTSALAGPRDDSPRNLRADANPEPPTARTYFRSDI